MKSVEVCAMSQGQTYTFNFPGSPGGSGVYVGTVDVGNAVWLAFKIRSGKVCYYNPALLCTIAEVGS